MIQKRNDKGNLKIFCDKWKGRQNISVHMSCSWNSSENEIQSFKCVYKKKRTQINNLTFHHKTLEKEDEIKHK